MYVFWFDKVHRASQHSSSFSTICNICMMRRALQTINTQKLASCNRYIVASTHPIETRKDLCVQACSGVRVRYSREEWGGGMVVATVRRIVHNLPNEVHTCDSFVSRAIALVAYMRVSWLCRVYTRSTHNATTACAEQHIVLRLRVCQNWWCECVCLLHETRSLSVKMLAGAMVS